LSKIILSADAVLPTGHSRAGGNPSVFELKSRLRGGDDHFVTKEVVSNKFKLLFFQDGE
jgi:hypothetical protein